MEIQGTNFRRSELPQPRSSKPSHHVLQGLMAPRGLDRLIARYRIGASCCLVGRSLQRLRFLRCSLSCLAERGVRCRAFKAEDIDMDLLTQIDDLAVGHRLRIRSGIAKLAPAAVAKVKLTFRGLREVVWVDFGPKPW